GKHLEIPGGVLVFPDSGRRDSLQRRAREALRTRPYSAVTAYKALSLLTAVGGPGWAPEWLGWLVGRSVLPSDRWQGHRMPYDPDAVGNAIAGGGGPDRFEHWVRMDELPYRTPWPRVAFAPVPSHLEPRRAPGEPPPSRPVPRVTPSDARPLPTDRRGSLDGREPPEDRGSELDRSDPHRVQMGSLNASLSKRARTIVAE